MVNKKVTDSNNPLVRVQYLILKSQKDYLDTLGGSASTYIRKLIEAQMSTREAEKRELIKEKTQHLAQVNIIDAQLKQLDEETNKVNLGADFINQRIESMVQNLKIECGNISKIKNGLKVSPALIKKKTGIDYTLKEFTNAVIDKAESQGVKVHGN